MTISKLYIDNEVIKYSLTKHISNNLKIPVRFVYNKVDFFKMLKRINNSVSFGKKNLYLTKNKSSFIKKCPGTQKNICCGYYTLNLGSFCPMDCSYCILQVYFKSPLNYLFVNYIKLEKELNNVFSEGKIVRFGTGEYSDSLIWENFSNISIKLIRKFSYQNKSVLELKTKTVNIKKFKDINHKKKTIISWSINTYNLINNEEISTSSINSRLEAASECASFGYPIAFHLDPVIIYKGYKKDYKKLIISIFDLVSPENIVWISIGSFRFMPLLKEIISKRFLNSRSIYNEFKKEVDGKMRYFKPIKVDAYKYIVKCIKKETQSVFIYFCMEDRYTWENSMNIEINKCSELSKMLDNSATIKCYLDKKI